MTPADLLTDALGRTAGNVDAVLAGLGTEELSHRPAAGANPIGWLVWHLTRVQDDHVATVAGREQIWTSEGYADRFDLPLEVGDIGFGHSVEQVGLVRPPAELLRDYHRAVHVATVEWLAGVRADDLDRVVDDRWDPPVTLGARLVSVVDECAQHVGQAAYVRGMLGR